VYDVCGVLMQDVFPGHGIVSDVVYRVYSFKGIIRYLGGGGSPFGFGAEEAVTGVVISTFLIVSVIEVIV